MTHDRTDFLIDRKDFRSTAWRQEPAEELQPGQARLRIDRFALTANNITYAVFGEKLRYWDFFPAPDGYGRLPVWGMADVAESRADGLAAGERIYGYFSMSSELVVTVGDLTAAGFADASPWRSELSAVYNRYWRISEDKAFGSPRLEALQSIFRPLFATSFLITGFLVENGFFGARQVLISSASSKTSLALACLLKNRSRDGLQIIGLTSDSNMTFVDETGFYDDVIDYEAVGTLAVVPTVFVDMAGSARLRSAVHHHFQDALHYSCAVGSSHWEDPGRASGLPGPRPTMFFAPGHVDAKVAMWGVEGYEKRLSEAWEPFADAVDGLLDISFHSGREEVERLYNAVLEGQFSPRFAAMASIQD